MRLGTMPHAGLAELLVPIARWVLALEEEDFRLGVGVFHPVLIEELGQRRLDAWC